MQKTVKLIYGGHHVELESDYKPPEEPEDVGSIDIGDVYMKVSIKGTTETIPVSMFMEELGVMGKLQEDAVEYLDEEYWGDKERYADEDYFEDDDDEEEYDDDGEEDSD